MAAQTSAPAPIPAAAVAGGGAPPAPRETYDSLVPRSDLANTSRSCISIGSSNVVDSRGPSSHQQHQQQSPQQGQIAPGRANPRFRSESCADELLAAGRITTDETFGSCSGGGDGGSRDGGGESSCGTAAAAAARRDGTAPGEAPKGRGQVSRSQSLDLGTAEVDGGERRDPLGKEAELSRRKVTQHVRGRDGFLSVFFFFCGSQFVQVIILSEREEEYIIV